MPRAKSQPSQDSQEYDPVGLDPIIEGLIAHLPAPGEPWPRGLRALWLQILGLAIELIYPDEEDGALGSDEEPDEPEASE